MRIIRFWLAALLIPRDRQAMRAIMRGCQSWLDDRDAAARRAIVITPRQIGYSPAEQWPLLECTICTAKFHDNADSTCQCPECLSLDVSLVA